MFNLKLSAAIFVIIATFIAGFKYAAALYEADIAQILKEHALAIKEKTDEYRSKEQLQAKQLAEAWNQFEQARAESVDLRADVERVRKLADSYRAKLSGTDSDSCAPVRERLASCTKLLEEGAKLSAEGAELAQRIAEKKDALSTMTRLAD
jgi:methylthioribose-1-phosphate isomerase